MLRGTGRHRLRCSAPSAAQNANAQSGFVARALDTMTISHREAACATGAHACAGPDELQPSARLYRAARGSCTGSSSTAWRQIQPVMLRCIVPILCWVARGFQRRVPCDVIDRPACRATSCGEMKQLLRLLRHLQPFSRSASTPLNPSTCLRKHASTQGHRHARTCTRCTRRDTRAARASTHRQDAPVDARMCRCAVRCAAVERSRKAAMGLGAATGVPAWCGTVEYGVWYHEYLRTLSMVQYRGLSVVSSSAKLEWQSSYTLPNGSWLQIACPSATEGRPSCTCTRAHAHKRTRAATHTHRYTYTSYTHAHEHTQTHCMRAHMHTHRSALALLCYRSEECHACGCSGSDTEQAQEEAHRASVRSRSQRQLP
jgi:hypothetical protein